MSTFRVEITCLKCGSHDIQHFYWHNDWDEGEGYECKNCGNVERW